MDDGLEKNFVEEMRDRLKKQMSEFELAQKQKQHRAKILLEEGRRRWLELTESLKTNIEAINDGLPEPLLSYSNHASMNEMGLRHELSENEMRICFDPTSATISYEDSKRKGTFQPQVYKDGLAYDWHETVFNERARSKRLIRLEDDDRPPKSMPTDEMSEIILRCVVSSLKS